MVDSVIRMTPFRFDWTSLFTLSVSCDTDGGFFSGVTSNWPLVTANTSSLLFNMWFRFFRHISSPSTAVVSC